LFLVNDASITGVGGTLLVGKNWWSAKPIGYHSKKFSNTEMNYATMDQELLAVHEGFRHFEDQLLGREVIILTDNQALQSFLKSKQLTRRQVRVQQYLAQFAYTIQYIKGSANLIADTLSRQYEDDDETTVRAPEEMIDVPEDFEPTTTVALSAMRTRRSPRRFDDSDPNAEARERQPKQQRKKRAPRAPKARTRAARKLERTRQRRSAEAWDEAPPELLATDGLTSPAILKAIAEEYHRDHLFAKVLDRPDHFRDFYWLDNGVLLHRLRKGESWRLCLPNAKLNGRSIREIFLEHYHVATGHLGAKRLTEEMNRHAWWPRMAKDIHKYVSSCPSCQATKKPTDKPTGLLHPLPIPSQPWDSVGIDFVGPVPPSRVSGNTYDYIMVVIDQLTGEVELIPTTKSGLDAQETARLYFTWVFPRHGLPSNIVSDRDVRFTNEFWKNLHEMMGTTLSMSSAYHPQSNGKTERVNRTVNSIMRNFVSEEQTDWALMLPMAQFAINSTVSEITGSSPFEINRGYIPRSLPAPSWSTDSAAENLDVTRFSERAQLALQVALDSIIQARVSQTFQANKHRRSGAPGGVGASAGWNVGDLAWLSTRNLHTVPGRAHKWTPRYVGPFEVVSSWTDTDTVELDLPERYTVRGISKVFHTSELKPYVASDEKVFPSRLTTRVPTFPLDSLEMEIKKVLTHRVSKDEEDKGFVEIMVRLGDNTTAWMPVSNPDIQVGGAYKSEYLQRLRVRDWSDLHENNVPVSDDNDKGPKRARESEADKDTASAIPHEKRQRRSALGPRADARSPERQLVRTTPGTAGGSETAPGVSESRAADARLQLSAPVSVRVTRSKGKERAQEEQRGESLPGNSLDFALQAHGHGVGPSERVEADEPNPKHT
jgi:transposase InsO family protein